MESKKITINKIAALLLFMLTCLFSQQATAQCSPTPGFPLAPSGINCAPGFNPIPVFTEDFNTSGGSFGVFTEDSPPGPGTTGSNDLTVSTNSDTPSFGTGPECPASGGPSTNEEFIFLEGSSTQAGETHCMTASIPVPASGGVVQGPFFMSFWYYMFGDNIGTLEIFINGASRFSVSGQQQTSQFQPWLQGAIDVSAEAGTNMTVRICMSEGNGQISTFESDISIDHIQVFGCAEVCDLTCSATPIIVDNDPGQCGALVDPSPAASSVCTNPIINDFNGTDNALDFYPVGTTTVTFTTTDEFGNLVTCSTDVTVNDVEGPSFTGCEDLTITLEPGACCAALNFDVHAEDNCAGGGNMSSSLTTIFARNNGASGNMFDVANLSGFPVIITGMFEANLATGATTDISVYYTTNASTYIGNETNAAEWTLLGTANNVTSSGINNPTPFDVGGSFTLMPGQSVGVFVSDNTSDIDYTNGANTYDDGVLQITAGIGRAVNVGNPFAGAVFNPRTWNGTIFYQQLQEIEVIQTDMSGFASGDCFPIGETVLTFEATDIGGTTNTCTKTITVEEFPNVRGSLSCNQDGIQVSLDENCTATVGADDVLEGTGYGCYDTRYEVKIDKNGNGIFDTFEGADLDGNDLGATYEVRVRDVVTGNSCWGVLTVEDKLIPDLNCTDITLPCSADITPGSDASANNASSLITPGTPFGPNNTSETINVSNASGLITDVNLRVDISHTWTDDVQIDLISPSGTSVRIITGQCGANDDLIATFDDAGGAIVCPIRGLLAPEGSLADFNGESALGDWTVDIVDLTPVVDNGTVNELELIISTAAVVEFPIAQGNGVTITPDGANRYIVSGFDGCGDAVLTYQDDEDLNTCQDGTITRDWKLTDGSGNMSTCTQTLTITPVGLDAVVPPTNYDGIDGRTTLLCENRCGDAAETADTRFCGPNNLYWAVIPDGQPYAGHPSPDASKNWGCGTAKCFGTGRPGGLGACSNIQSTFADTRINICTSGPSEGCYKVLRAWTVLDWCTGDVRFFNQVIKVEDNKAPQIADVADLTISVDVWRCEADWLATEPWLMDNCSSEPLEYTVSSTGGTVQQLPDGRYRILGLVPGTYDVTYSASDCCGNVGDSTITLTVLDDVAPVAVCDGHTVVSISRTTNIDDENLGLTKIFATTFDDGSYDNCSDVVWFKAIRMDEYDSNGDGKFPERVQDGDWRSIDCDAANGDDDLRTRPSFYQGPQSYFDDYVKFCCDDIADGPIMVVFRVYDVDPEPYTFGRQFPNLVPAGENPDDYNGVLPEAQDVGGPLYGRYDDCMIEVSVQDKLPPYVVAPPNITVTCDYWFPFDADNPADYTDELDAIFGKVVEGSADPADRDSISIRDRVCPAHPRFAEFAPANPADDQCYDDKYDIFWGYDGYVLDNCSVNLEQTIIPDLHCGRGDILRRWRAGDDAGNWSNIATQVITIIDCKEFYVPTVCWRFTQKDIGECDRQLDGSYKIKLIEWPCDVEVNRCQTAGLDALTPENLPVPFDQDRRPRYDDDNCNLLGATYVDRTFTFVDNACVKIFRDWTVIDWCLYEDGVTPYEWNWTQVIKLLNTEGPVFDDCEDKEFCGFGDPAFPNNNQCVGEVVLEPGITDDCSELATIRTDYKIDAFNDGGYDILGYSDNHPVNPFGAGVTARVYPATSPNANGKYPVGQHRILWTAEDGCGNITTCEYLFTVQDCKPPTPYCRNGVSTIPMPIDAGGYVEIWASDYNIGSYDNCTAQGDLIYSFSDDPTDASRRFVCADAPGIYNLTVYVWDLGLDGLPRNYATCGVTIQLEDCGNQTTYNVAGAIENESGVEASDVMVQVSGDMDVNMTTDNSGTFGFALDADNNYVVAPEKDVDHRNGVSTFDLVLISKHITGQQALNSPYKMIAADVNNTGSITTFDIIELRKLILYINTEFPDNTSWRFVPSDHVFPNSDPFTSSFPEVYTINNLGTDMNVDFVAIKVGDVNESARANNLVAPGQTRSAGELNFKVKDQLLNKGEQYTVDFTAADFANILGYQFTLNYSDAVEVTEVKGGELAGLAEGNFGKLAGAITTSWNAAKAANLSSDDVVFSITLTANADVKLSDVLSIGSEYTSAEAYNAGGYLNVALNFTTEAGAEFALYQNQPNPFADATVIGFNLPQAGTATLSIYDVAGKVLKVVEGDYSKGYNEVTVNRGELSGTGLLYYTLQTQNESATKKMIIIE